MRTLLLILALLYSPIHVAAQSDSVGLARLFVSECGWSCTLEEMAAIQQALQNRADLRDASFHSQLRAHRTVFEGGQPARPWLAELTANGTKPPSWDDSTTVPWPSRRQAWLSTLASATTVLANPWNPCDYPPLDWGVSSAVSRYREHNVNAITLECGATRNVFLRPAPYPKQSTEPETWPPASWGDHPVSPNWRGEDELSPQGYDQYKDPAHYKPNNSPQNRRVPPRREVFPCSLFGSQGCLQFARSGLEYGYLIGSEGQGLSSQVELFPVRLSISQCRNRYPCLFQWEPKPVLPFMLEGRYLGPTRGRNEKNQYPNNGA